ncbi:MAG: hypothetical protein WAQ09_01335, partial [Bacillota bacterium]
MPVGLNDLVRCSSVALLGLWVFSAGLRFLLSKMKSCGTLRHRYNDRGSFPRMKATQYDTYSHKVIKYKEIGINVM